MHDLVPRKYEALTGTLAPAPESVMGNSQVDLMVVNTLEFPVLVRDGVLAAVLPHSVEVTVEIKTDLGDGKKILEALRQIRRIHRLFPLEKPPLSILFSYGYPANSVTMAKHIKSALQSPVSPDDGEVVAQWRASDVPDYIVTSGVQGACIAKTQAIGPTELRQQVFDVAPADTVSFLLGRILAQITPKPSRGAVSSGVKLQRAAWSWVEEYFDIYRVRIFLGNRKTSRFNESGQDRSAWA